MTLPKIGLKTTEFWLVVAAFVTGWLETTLGFELPKESLYGILAYILTRGWVKANGSK